MGSYLFQLIIFTISVLYIPFQIINSWGYWKYRKNRFSIRTNKILEFIALIFLFGYFPIYNL